MRPTCSGESIKYRVTSALSRLTVLLQRLMRRAEVNRAVVYGIVTNGWRLITGPVIIFLIATLFTPVVQGFYYTFGSVLGLQYFVELSFGTVIIQFASHEWSKLGLDSQGRIEGESEALSRLVSLGRLVFRWYLVGGGIVAVGLGIGGYIFFSQSAYPGINWVAPWFVLCVLSGIKFWLVPVWSLLMGCNRVASVYNFRMIGGILSSLSIWAAVLFGAGLWTPAVSTAVSIAWAGVFLVWRYQNFFRPFFSHITGPGVSWAREVWPMQWRLALSSVGGYFIAYFFTPVLFHYHGAVVAGQMGMTWYLAVSLGAISSLWAATQAPRFGMLIAKKKYKDLDRLFFRIAIMTIAVLFSGAIVIWLLIYLLYALDNPLSARLLPPLPTGLFLLGQIAMYSTSPLAVYLRAHKREPFLGVSVVSGFLIGLLTWLLGSRFAATGAAVAYVSVSAFVALPYAIVVWYRCRAAWHSDAVEHCSASSVE